MCAKHAHWVSRDKLLRTIEARSNTESLLKSRQSIELEKTTKVSSLFVIKMSSLRRSARKKQSSKRYSEDTYETDDSQRSSVEYNEGHNDFAIPNSFPHEPPQEESKDDATTNNINNSTSYVHTDHISNTQELEISAHNAQLTDQEEELPISVYNKEQHLLYLEKTSKWTLAVDMLEDAFKKFDKEEHSLVILFDKITDAVASLNEISIKKRAASNNDNNNNATRVRHLVANSMIGSANNYLKSNGLYNPSLQEINEKIKIDDNALENEIADLNRVLQSIKLYGSGPNRKTFSHEEILNKIESCRGTTSDSHGVSVNMFKVIARRGDENACRACMQYARIYE